MPTVLIADQDEDNRTILSTALRAAHLNVIDTADAESARELATRSGVDLILLNYPMILRDGTTLTRAIREDQHLSRVPIINLMSHVTPQLTAEAAADGVTHTLFKPIDVWTLMQLIRRCLRKHDLP
jgi:CheY-like chemotaxis protein